MTSGYTLRVSAFLVVLVVVALWEFIAPRRRMLTGRRKRWFANLSLVVIDNAVARVLFPVMPVGMAFIAKEKGWGLLNFVDFPWLAEVAIAVIVLDLVIYLQHVAFHFLPLLWRLHRMHHSDLDLDVTSGNRFHPLEIMISLVLKLGVVALIGVDPGAVIAFEVILNSCSMFSHGNVRLPIPIDRYLRLLIVTPDMHRVHHSVIPRETNSNYGFCLTWWDRLFKTYREQPEAGHEAMLIGLKEFRDPERLRLLHLLVQPFVNRKSGMTVD
ncbi:sterol desaturase family protein [Geobacter pelophilus]|uniref:Sterol desaturase family protein n=1 Tax=Geoanaerobacter pelophilus TaxID=60036 RepID=A0AAW4LB04_9BACT|nr:sterol desaturase family protein [Geoanaerobacter pelophilus]MBT0665199.1 sterol desaturase family protein [Geoanaerobacter pelophilus]